MGRVTCRDFLYQLPIDDVDDCHPVVYLRGQVKTSIVWAKKAVVEDMAHVFQLVDRKVWVRIIDPPHLPRFFKREDKIRSHQVW